MDGVNDADVLERHNIIKGARHSVGGNNIVILQIGDWVEANGVNLLAWFLHYFDEDSLLLTGNMRMVAIVV